MKKIMIMLFLPLAISPAWSQDLKTSEEDVFLFGFLEGSYHLIGKFPDSDRTYSGKVIFTFEGNRLKVVRTIDNKRYSGTGDIEKALADEIPVLKVQFQQDTIHYEATYLIDSDLDNYGRLSGYLYRVDGSTKTPGLEALFIDRQVTRE